MGLEVTVPDKMELRKLALRQRDAVPQTDRRAWSWEIQNKVRDSLWYKEAEIVLSYSAFRSEADTGAINKWILQDGKKLYLPKTYPRRHEMIYYQVEDLSCTESGYQGIQEPLEGISWNPEKQNKEIVVLMLMPGAAFDLCGNRIGYGGGYYDRYLGLYGASISHKIMLAFAMQQMPQIPAEECDIPPDQVVTNEVRKGRLSI